MQYSGSRKFSDWHPLASHTAVLALTPASAAHFFFTPPLDLLDDSHGWFGGGDNRERKVLHTLGATDIVPQQFFHLVQVLFSCSYGTKALFPDSVLAFVNISGLCYCSIIFIGLFSHTSSLA